MAESRGIITRKAFIHKVTQHTMSGLSNGGTVKEGGFSKCRFFNTQHIKLTYYDIFCAANSWVSDKEFVNVKLRISA